ncbi:MAG: succinyldiaminopimelate transaminase [Aeromicrobium sp.]
MGRRRMSARFPDFPLDTIAAAKARAASHAEGIVDLSIGSPVDDSPALAQQALARAANAPGYPTVSGPESLRQAAADYLARRFGVQGLDTSAVLPTIGSKELIANLPVQLGLGGDDLIVVPELAYPTYEVGARYAGCEVVAADSTVALGPRMPALIYLNSPANPHGQVLGVDHLRKVVDWARDRGTLVVSDECYLEFGWDAEPISVLHPDVCGDSHDGIIALHSASKRSSLAGYRDAMVVGDRSVVHELLEVRKHLGFMQPSPVAAAMEAVLGDDAHVDTQRELYRSRRATLRAALEAAGFRIEHSEGSLYLWASRVVDGCGENGRATLDWLADRGILVAPGDFYGPGGAEFVRIAFMATDERIAAAASRLA